jgi:hypothetical protein
VKRICPWTKAPAPSLQVSLSLNIASPTKIQKNSRGRFRSFFVQLTFRQKTSPNDLLRDDPVVKGSEPAFEGTVYLTNTISKITQETTYAFKDGVQGPLQAPIALTFDVGAEERVRSRVALHLPSTIGSGTRPRPQLQFSRSGHGLLELTREPNPTSRYWRHFSGSHYCFPQKRDLCYQCTARCLD